MSEQLAVLKNELKTVPGVKTLYWCYEQMKEGKIVTIPPFLQRQLQKRVWEMTGSTKSKQYLYSAFKATSLFDPFILVKLSLLINLLEDELKEWKSNKKTDLVNQGTMVLNDLKTKLSKGGEWAKIDGQSRSKLALTPFFESKQTIDESMKYDLFDNDEYTETFDIKGIPFNKMPLSVRNTLKRKPAIIIVIEDGTLDDIVKALISKQQGEKFTKFQEIYHGKYISVLANRLRTHIKKPIRDAYKKYVNQNDKYKEEQAGLELLVTSLSSFFKYRDWPSYDKIKRIIDNSDDIPSEALIEQITGYMNEFFDYYKLDKDFNKFSSTVLKNWILYRYMLDNADKKESFYSQYGFPEIKISQKKSFVKDFIEMDKILTSKVIEGSDDLNEDSWEIVGGKYNPKAGGYVAGNNNDKTEYIEWKLHAIAKVLNSRLNKLITENVITVENIEMPDMVDVEVYNGFKNIDGEVSDPRDKKHRGHKKSVKNKGSNKFENIAPQKPQDNLEYNKRDVVLNDK